MVVEIAEFRVHPNDHEKFGVALRSGVDSILAKAHGYQSHRILAGIESPGRYLLMVEWASIEDHMVGFRESPAFARWRAVIGPFFFAPPDMEHFIAIEHASA